MGLAADAQDRARPEFREMALQAIQQVAMLQEFVHVNDVLMQLGDERPTHPNCWGSIWREATKNDWIIMTDRTKQCVDPRKHRHRSPIYRSLIYRSGMQ